MDKLDYRIVRVHPCRREMTNFKNNSGASARRNRRRAAPDATS